MSLKQEPLDEELMEEPTEMADGMTDVFASVWVKAELDEAGPSAEESIGPRTRSGERKPPKKRDPVIPPLKIKVPKKSRPKTILSCQHCDFKTIHKNSLQQHERSHTGERLRCEYCDYETKFAACLKRHQENKHREILLKNGKTFPTLYCEYCPYNTVSKYLLNFHQRRHKKDKQYKCQHCSFETAYRHSFSKHCKTHAGNAMYKCDKCPYETKFRGRIERHLELIHNQILEAKYSCDYCGATSKERWKLKMHQKKSMSKGYINCPLCEFHTFYKCAYRKHKKLHEGTVDMNRVEQPIQVIKKPHGESANVKKDEQGVLSCEKCPYTTMYNEDMTSHLVDIHNVCKICWKYYSDVYNLRTHQMKSKKEEKIKCPACDFESFYKCEMATHKTTHYQEFERKVDNIEQVDQTVNTEISSYEDPNKILQNISPLQSYQSYPPYDNEIAESNKEIGQCKFGSFIVDKSCVEWNTIQVLETGQCDRPFQCHLCDYTSKFKASVQRHFQRHHTNSKNKPYRCCNCEFSTKTKDQIALHNKKSLSTVLVSCHHCEYKSYYKCAITSHQRTHYANKCQICQFAYKHKHELARHMETIHMGKGLKCRFCDFMATRKDSLLSHETVHTGVKPYKCQFCEYTSVRNSMLIQHYIKHHHSEYQNMPKKEEKAKNESKTEDRVRFPGEKVIISTDHIEALKVPLDEPPIDNKPEANEQNDSTNFCSVTNTANLDQFISEDTEIKDDDAKNSEDEKDYGNNFDNVDNVEYLEEDTLSPPPPANDEIKVDGHIKKLGKNKFGKYIIDTSCVDWSKIQVLMTDDSEQPFQCYLCDFRSRFRNSVKRHFQRHHTSTENRPYHCLHCDFATKTRDAIGKHNSKIKSDKLLICKVCKYSTNYKCAFVVHQRKHYPYKCKICKFRYKLQAELTRHFAAAHLGTGLKCRYCDFVAARKDSVLVHETIHTGRKPFKCDSCDFSSVRKYYLVSHLKKVHNMEYKREKKAGKKKKEKRKENKKFNDCVRQIMEEIDEVPETH